VSSILDALEKLERTRPPTIEPAPVVVPPPRRTRVIVLVGSAFAAGAVLALGLLRSRPTVTPRVVPPPVEAPEAKQLPAEPVEQVAAQPAPAAPAQEAIPPKPEPVSAPPPQAAPPPPEAAAPPAGTAATAAATAPAADAPHAPPAADAPHAPAPEVLATARPVPPPSPAGPRPWAQPAAPPAPPPPAEVTAPPRAAQAPTYAHLEPPAVRKPPAGAPAVRLSFLLYSPAPGRRTVALAIENRGLETLHEGETSNDGVEVVRILPDRVELGWNGEHFTVRARD
jgi:hypothetical protein